MDYPKFLQFINEELNYLQAFDIGTEPDYMKAAGALQVLKEYVEKEIKEESLSKVVPFS